MINEVGKTVLETIKEVGKEIAKATLETSDILKNIDIDKKIGHNIDKTKYPEDNKKMGSINIDKKIPERKSDIDKESDVKDIKKAENNQLGGSYKDLKKSKNYDSKKHEIHHMPADSINEINRSDGPAIIMDKRDHRKTASSGSSNEAKAYRDKQAEYIKKGDFDKALDMDIKDIKDKFGNKYDKQISEMKEYVNELKKRGDI